MLEDEQSFKHGGGLPLEVLCCLKVRRSIKMMNKKEKIEGKKKR
jgi:hypothetical protein